jgi:hypothetical protein
MFVCTCIMKCDHHEFLIKGFCMNLGNKSLIYPKYRVTNTILHQKKFQFTIA